MAIDKVIPTPLWLPDKWQSQGQVNYLPLANVLNATGQAIHQHQTNSPGCTLSIPGFLQARLSSVLPHSYSWEYREKHHMVFASRSSNTRHHLLVRGQGQRNRGLSEP